MVKGVHKKIIELNHPDSVYFEKAVFYLKPGITHFPAQMAESEARRVLNHSDLKSGFPPRRWRKVGMIMTVSLISSCITMAFCYLLIR